MPSGALGPNTYRKNKSPHWVTSALPVCPTFLVLTMTLPSLPRLPHVAPRMSGGHTGKGSWLLFLWAAGGLGNVLSVDWELPESRNHVWSLAESSVPRAGAGTKQDA